MPFEADHRAKLCRKLEKSGWTLKRVRGSHHIFTKTGERKIIAVPVHGNRDLTPGLTARIVKDAGLE